MFETLAEMFGVDPKHYEITPSSKYWNDYNNLIKKVYSTTSLENLTGIMAEASDLFDKIIEEKKNTATSTLTEDNNVKENVKPSTTYETLDTASKDKIVFRNFDNITYSSCHKFNKENMTWEYAIITPGASKEDIRLAFDAAGQNVIRLFVLNALDGGTYTHDIIVNTFGRTVDSIKYKVSCGVTYINVHLKDKEIINDLIQEMD